MYSFWQTVANTPWWVFAIYCYLIWLSFLASKPRIVPIRTFFLIPSIMLMFIFFWFIYFFEWNLPAIGYSLGAILIGILIGWLQFTLYKVKVLKESTEIFIPGNFVLLGLVLIALISQYLFETKVPLSLEELKQPMYARFFLSTYGFLIGLLIGKLIYVKQRY